MAWEIGFFKKQLGFFLGILFLYSPMVAQATTTDTTEVLELIDESRSYLFNYIDSLDKSKNLAEQAHQKSSQINYRYGRVKALNMIASVFYQMGTLDSSVYYFEKAIQLQTEVGENNMDMYRLKDNLADVLYDLGEKDRALRYKLDARDFFLSKKDTSAFLIAVNGLGYVYMMEGEWLKARDILKVVTKYDRSDDYVIEPYGNLGIIYQHLNQLDSAEYFMKKAGNLAKAYPLFYLDNQLALALVMKKRGKEKEALNTMLEVLEHFDENSKELSYHRLLLYIAEFYHEQGEELEAKRYLEQASALIPEDNPKLNKRMAYIGKEIYRELEDWKTSLDYTDQYHYFTDSLASAKQDSAFYAIETQYNVEKKNAVINQQKLALQRYYLWILALTAFGIILALILLSVNRKRKFQNQFLEEKNKRKDLQIESLRKENQLVSLQSVLEGQEEERRRIAQDLHDNVGSMMAAMKMKVLTIQKNIEALESMNINLELDKMINQVGAEVRRISHNMTPLSFEHAGLHGAVSDLIHLLNEHQFQVESNIEGLEEIENDEKAIMIYRILQELVQNIIKHSQASEVEITATWQKNLMLMVKDNGKGFDLDRWNAEDSFGLKSLKSRVKYLEGHIHLNNSQGSSFEIEIPMKRRNND